MPRRSRIRFEWHCDAKARDLDALDRNERAELAALIEGLDGQVDHARGVRRVKEASIAVPETDDLIVLLYARRHDGRGLAGLHVFKVAKYVPAADPLVASEAAYQLAEARLELMADW